MNPPLLTIHKQHFTAHSLSLETNGDGNYILCAWTHAEPNCITIDLDRDDLRQLRDAIDSELKPRAKSATEINTGLCIESHPAITNLYDCMKALRDELREFQSAVHADTLRISAKALSGRMTAAEERIQELDENVSALERFSRNLFARMDALEAPSDEQPSPASITTGEQPQNDPHASVDAFGNYVRDFCGVCKDCRG